jgi:predicted nucleic acid-binding protein
VPTFGERLLGIDIQVARCCARLQAGAPRNWPDALIAATALVHRMTVVTRNTREFEAMGVPVLNPWVS